VNPQPPALDPISDDPPMSLPARLLNVFAAPGDVFEEVAAAKHAVGNWLLPAILGCAVAVSGVLVMFSQPALVRQMQEQQTRAMEQQVAKGKMTREQTEKAVETMAPFIKAFAAVAAVLASVGGLLLVSLGLWGVSSLVWKAQAPFSKVLEVVGLSSMITVLGGVVWALLLVATGNLMASAGPILLVDKPDPANLNHQLLAAVNVITLWYVGVLAVGMARITRKPVAVTAAWTFAGWLVLRGGGVALAVLGARAQG
jgi:hypothetical protein